MPLISNNQNFSFTTTVVAILFVVLFAFMSFLSFCFDYPSLGFLSASLVLVIGGLALWISFPGGWLGWVVLLIGIVLFLGTCWLGKPIVEGKLLLQHMGLLS
jgi:hypothetical protein